LPGWKDLAWSLLLVPGWRELGGRSLGEIVTEQWITATRILLDDLEALPADRWCVAGYDRLVSDPQAEIERLCDFTGLAWDRPLTAPLPLSRHTLTSPAPDKWRHNAGELQAVIARVTPVAERARRVFAHPPARRPIHRSPAEGPRSVAPVASAPGTAASPEAFRSVYTAGVPALLRELGISLLVSTYQSGRVIAARADGDRLNTHFRAFPSPMGIAVGPRYLAIGTQRHVWEYRNQPEVGQRLDPPGRHDAVFLPRASHVTGDIRIHEMAFAGDELWIVNTRFSCLSVLDREHSFVPRWRPPFVTALSPEDRCHLNGLAVADGRVRWVTALGATDTPNGWREDKARGGVLMDVPSGEIVARGLSMPHAPRWYGGKLWVLESGKGTLAVVDPVSGRVDTVTELPGFTRGLAFAGPFAFVGLSQVRESNIFGGLPLTERVKEKLCGVWVVDLRTGKVAGFLRFEGLVQEIFDVQLLRARWPEIAEPDSDLIASSFALPDEALAREEPFD
ncbi:MAG TPA: TIGR03032 family protein, partial [Thermoanaerobaculia bacterium]|nr:TIGR03032 family protein [Thermoanaerobaculia bacterium]